MVQSPDPGPRGPGYADTKGDAVEPGGAVDAVEPGGAVDAVEPGGPVDACDFGRAAPTTERQKRVLKAALEVFAAKGLDGASTAEIAKRAGVAEGTLFKRYRSKKALLMAVVSPFFVRFAIPAAIDPAKRILSDDSRPLEEVLAAVIAERAQLLEGNWREFKAIAQEAARLPELRSALIDHLAVSAREVLEGFFARRIAMGEVRNLDTFMLSRALATLAFTHVMATHAFPADFVGRDLEEQAAAMADILVNGIRAR